MPLQPGGLEAVREDTVRSDNTILLFESKGRQLVHYPLSDQLLA